jgi:CRP/FNR family transcriptional regulator, cyclic AMP receptor protein
MSKNTDLLKKVPLFSDCSVKELTQIAAATKPVKQKAGTVLAREGEPGIGLFVIVSGSAEVSIGGVKRASLGGGDFFGEVALLDGGPRTATVTAKSDMELLGITEWVFRGLMHEHPSIALKTLQAVAGRLRDATKVPTA